MGQTFSTIQYYAALSALFAVGSVVSLALFLAIVTQLKALREQGMLDPSLPFVGRQKELFAAIRANVRGMTESASLYIDAYRTYSLKNKISIVPTWTKGPQVLLPPSMIHWLARQPEKELSARDCTFESQQFKYTLQHPEIQHNDMLDVMIKRDLTKSVGQLNNEVIEEIDICSKELFETGADADGWKDVSVWDAMIKIVTRADNRCFVGEELCRNEEYFNTCVKWTMAISVSSSILHMFPKFLKPIVAWFATMPNRRATDSFMRLTQPLVEQRLEEMKIGRDDPKYEAPNELVTWLVRESFKRNTKSETSAEALAYRVLLLNFAAVSTSTIATSNAIFDFISAPNFEEIIPAMREEAAAALDANGGVWTNAAVKSLRRLDSALRESARISGVGGTGLARRVRLSGGVTLPDGTWIPQGATIGVAQRGLNTDPSHYGETGEAFDAFRFSRPREEAEKMDGPLPENEDLATTSPNFLAFSHGLHACPGRFFAINQLKLIMAHILLNYDIQPLPIRPDNIALGDVMIPPLKATMRIRRREVKA